MIIGGAHVRVRQAALLRIKAGGEYFTHPCPEKAMAQIEVLSEITGVVCEVEVKPGDKVEEGDSLLLIEAMKMEIPVLATEDGTVAKILVAEKDAVTEGQPLVVLDT